MSVLDEALYSYLSSDTRLTELVSDRIYPVRIAPKSLLPCVVWQPTSAIREYTFDPFEDTSAWVKALVQFSCWSENPKIAFDVGDAVLFALSGYSGDMAGEYIGSSMAELELADYEPDTKLFRRLLDFRISYEDPPRS